MDGANAASAASRANKSSLGSRVTSALVLLPLLIVLVWWSIWSVSITVALAAVACVLELYAVFAAGGFRPRRLLGACITILLVAAVALQPLIPFNILPVLLTLSILLSLVAELPRHNVPELLPNWGLTLGGALYIGWLLSHFILLRAISAPLNPHGLLIGLGLGIAPGAAWVFTVMAITFLQDTFAYFVGRSWGRHKMAPILSPKKTWEGAAGGMSGAIVASFASLLLLGLPISLGACALLGIVGGIVGPLGDLAESMIKRQIGVKDTGNIIPGHGGLLDRTDSLLFTAPVLYYMILLFMR